VKTIRSYSDRKTLESVFKEHKVSIEDRIKLLTKAMGNLAISYTCGFPSTKERYEVIITSFIDGIWKIGLFSLFLQRLLIFDGEYPNRI